MYADEKSDEAIVPSKRPNKGRQLPAEVVEGRASPEGNSRQAAPIGGCAPERRGGAPTSDPREEPGALAAHAGIRAGAAGNSRSYRNHAARKDSAVRQGAGDPPNKPNGSAAEERACACNGLALPNAQLECERPIPG